MLRELKSASAAIAIVVGLAGHASVADAAFVFQGSLGAPNGVAQFTFTVGAGSGNVTLETFNYNAGSGVFSGAGNATGGFDPVLTLFDSTGKFLTDFRTNISSGNLDAQIVTDGASNPPLSAGTYYATLTQFDNTFDSSGNLFTNPTFLRQSQPNYTTTAQNLGGLGSAFAYTDRNLTDRFNAWKVGIDGVTNATFVPLPGALVLLATAVAGIGALGYRQRRGPSMAESA